METKSFGVRCQRWFSGCLCSISFVVIVNGKPHEWFQAVRGLRQGQPLSPFLFTMVDVLSRVLTRPVERDRMRGLIVSVERIEVSHLQFVDDTVGFLQDDDRSIRNTFTIL